MEENLLRQLYLGKMSENELQSRFFGAGEAGWDCVNSIFWILSKPVHNAANLAHFYAIWLPAGAVHYFQQLSNILNWNLKIGRLRFNTSQGMTGSGSSLKKSFKALVSACTLSMVDRISKLPWGRRDRVGGFGKSNCLVYLLFDHLHITVSPTYPVEAVSCDEIGPEIKWKSL